MEEYNPKLSEILKKEDLKETEKTTFIGCEKCEAGYLEDGKMCECLKLEIKKRKYKNANIDYDYASLPIIEEEIVAYLKDGDDKIRIKINPFIKQFINNAQNNLKNGIGFIINGPTGRGKSLTSMKIIMNLVDKGYKCYFTTVKNFLDIIKSSWNEENDKDLLNYIYNCDFLVFDDLGVELHKTDWTLTELDSLFRHRYYKKKPTLITTNSTLEKLKAQYAQRIISLFYERSLIISIVSQDDYRIKNAKIPNYYNLDELKGDE